MKNEKINKINYMLVLFWLFAAVICGCVTRPVVVTTDESVIASQASVVKLQTINDGLRDILQFADNTIGKQIGQSISGIDDALNALDRYDEFVQGCIGRIRKLELATRGGENQEQTINETVMDTWDWSGGYVDTENSEDNPWLR